MFGSNIGVDIGSTAVRAVQTGDGRNRYKIVEAAEMLLPSGAVVGGEIRDPQIVADSLRALWKQNKFRGRTVTVGLEGQQTMVRQVDLPWEPPNIFREALPLRVSHDLPVDPSEMVLDSYPLADFTQRNVLMQRSLVVGTLSVAPENAESALQLAKLRSRRADFSPFALIRAAHYCTEVGNPIPGPIDPKTEIEAQAIVSLGAQITTVIVHYHGKPLFVRTVNVGSEAVSRALAEQLRVPFDVGEYLKRRLGLGQITPTPFTEELDEQIPVGAEKVAQQIINIMAGTLVQSARESVEYYLTATPNVSRIDSILLSGGGTLLAGYGERLQSELRAPAQYLNPLATYGTPNILTRTGAADPKFGVAYGLAVKAGKN